jgi:hypothetical protein
VPAREPSLVDINGLIARSKAYWDWPEGYLARAPPLHRVSPAYLRDNYCFEALDAYNRLVGSGRVQRRTRIDPLRPLR